MPRLAWTTAASLFIAGAVAAQAPTAVALEPGDALTIRTDGSGAMDISPRSAAEWTRFDLAAARHLSGLPIPDQPVPQATVVTQGEGFPPPPPIEPNMIRVKFQSIAGRHSLLVIENGYDRAIVYHARMTRGGRTVPTDVCLITPNQHGFEHWPYPIERIELSEIRFVDWRAGDPQPCA